MLYVCVRDVMDVFCLHCDAWSCRCSYIKSMSASSCRCCIFVSCVHHMAVLNTAFCMTCSLLIRVEDARGYHMEETYSRAGLMTVLYIGSHECPPLFTPSCCCECFYHLEWLILGCCDVCTVCEFWV